MKNFSFVVLIAMALTLVACGNKNESGGSSKNSVDTNSFSSQTVNGYIDHANPLVFIVGGSSYRIIDQYNMMTKAYNDSRITYYPRYKVQLTGIFTSNQVNNGNYYPNQQQQQPMTVIPSSARFSKP